MNFTKSSIPYSDTNSFSKLVIDYINGNKSLQPFFEFEPNLEGLKNAIQKRKNYSVNRTLLVEVLRNQYKNFDLSDKLKTNIDNLLDENTYTICTAHQPNIFTGHLYFIYKILHAIKLANTLAEQLPNYNFVPVYYMGSEDADLEELGEVYINGTQYKWHTKQTGAVGRMLIDDDFINIINEIAGQLLVGDFGETIISSVRNSYKLGLTIEAATFNFVHHLFNHYGLVVLLPDNALLKNEFAPVIENELTQQFSQQAVLQTVNNFPKAYKVQAAGRAINLFYLKDNSRERIEASENGFTVTNTHIEFTKEEILAELKQHPQRFSPNVILRPLFQETILPNIAFIGGGGELSYWLELKNVFDVAKVFFPTILLRNSFTVVNKKASELSSKLKLNEVDYFSNEKDLLEKIVKAETSIQLDLIQEKELLKKAYEEVKKVANTIDSSLNCHVHALRTQALNKLDVLEKKMLKAEKKKFESQKRQIVKFKSIVSPNGNLQERVDNILEYLSKYGDGFIEILYHNSNVHESNFTILTEQ